MVWSGCTRCGVLLLAALAVGGCRPREAESTRSAAPRESSPHSPISPVAGGLGAEHGANEGASETAAVNRLNPDPAGLHNVFQVSAQVYSGSEPQGQVAFDSLVMLGVKTIVSVDGARPQVELARARGLRYVHIPIGYDGVPERARLALARVMGETAGPVYIHCHHGKHRGPAAAAVACLAARQLDVAGAEVLLQSAGTSPDYAGLYRDVREFVGPGPGQELPELVEVATVASLVSGMADLGRHFDDLKACRQAKWQTPAVHPDLAPRGVARLVHEGLREIGRTADLSGYSAEFQQMLETSEGMAERLVRALEKSEYAQAEVEFIGLEKSCQQCHAQWRDH